MSCGSYRNYRCEGDLMSVDLLLARRYARAFFRLHHAHLTMEDAHKCEQIGRVFNEQRICRMYVMLPLLAGDPVYRIITALVQSYPLSVSLDSLLRLLQQHQRLSLLGLVCDELALCIRGQYSSEKVSVITAQEIGSSEQSEIIKAISLLRKCTVEAQFSCDPQLIAGMIIVGDGFVWERSIRAQLRALAKIC